VSRPGSEEVRRARVWLSRAVEPGSLALHRLLATCGPVEAVRLIRAGEAPGPVARMAEARRTADRVDADLADAERLGLRLVTPEDDEWPDAALHPMEVACALDRDDLAAPLLLWVRGAARLDDVLAGAVAVVGSRDATPYGRHVAADLGHELARRGWTVVSGGAYGIDAAAHRGALVAGGTTVAVVAGGLRSPYPAGNATLFDNVAGSGLVLSEWPPDCPPHRHRFLVRNRLIAAFGAGTVVVEAGARSGAESTARRARELGRVVMALPGPVTSAMSVGTHHLIREGALLVTGAAHVLEAVGTLGVDLAPPPRAEPTARDRLDPLARRVLDGMPAREPASPDRIAVDAGVPVVDVLRCLPALEIQGFVHPTTTGWRLTPAARH